MAATKGNSSSASGNVSTLVWTHTLGTGPNLALVVNVAADDGDTITSVVWDADGVNEALSSLREDANAGIGRTGIFYRLNPSAATGSSQITITFSAKGRVGAGAYTFSNVQSVDNATGAQGETGAANNLLVSNTREIDYTVDCIRVGDDTLLAVAYSHQTLDWTYATGGSIGAGGSTGRTSTKAFLGLTGWTWLNSAEWVHTAARIASTPQAVDDEGIRAPVPPVPPVDVTLWG